MLEEVGIFEDDSEPSFERWLVGRLEGLAPGIRSKAERWARVLRDGGPRSLPRKEGTLWLSLNHVRPTLLEWSNRYDHLREVTRNDVLAHIKTLHGHQRRDQLTALRSLFTWAKRQDHVFRNPISRIKVGQSEYAVLQPVLPEQVERSATAATTRAVRLVLALAAVHAARVAHIDALTLEGRPNRRGRRAERGGCGIGSGRRGRTSWIVCGSASGQRMQGRILSGCAVCTYFTATLG
ncbi:hypothetical protein [Streptomyces anthocyanicus]|uniref:hypothetical protein n=1 Tax=Streptomyces anthocyanicus TaxID=68174 RepID=UPI00387312E0|nr:hypothetical protein OG855_04965 [Streptomyces anthocyanicus]